MQQQPGNNQDSLMQQQRQLMQVKDDDNLGVRNEVVVALYASSLTHAAVLEKIPSFLAEIKLATQVRDLQRNESNI
uniref:Uncharacterized protein n=1 Tax=Salix viminalis TaxID=40686 RepID=A0A6N2NA49_SALVM